MKHSARYVLLAFSLAAPALVAAAPNVTKEPAESRVITLGAHTPKYFRPSSNNGFVLIALRNSSLLVNDQAVTLRAGESQQVTGSRVLNIVNTSTLPAQLVLVKIDTAFQRLTISQEDLDPHRHSKMQATATTRW